MATATRATIDDLYKVEGKAELIGGRIVTEMPTGFTPWRVAFQIMKKLDDFAVATGRGVACGEPMGFTVPELSSGRETFCPDAAYLDAVMPAKHMKFVKAAPTFAVEVRSEGDYGPAAEREMAAKRADYFEAGTLVVWDVDPDAGLIHRYRRDDPATPITFSRGQLADAEPAVPGWTIRVDDAFA